MGKRIIIQGADFSYNAINGIIYSNIFMEHGGIDLTNSNTFGDKNNSSLSNRLNTQTSIYVPDGAKLYIKGVTGLKLDYAYYNNSVISHTYMVGSFSNKIEDKYFTLTDGMQDSIIITNNLGQNYFFVICAKGINNEYLNQRYISYAVV